MAVSKQEKRAVREMARVLQDIAGIAGDLSCAMGGLKAGDAEWLARAKETGLSEGRETANRIPEDGQTAIMTEYMRRWWKLALECDHRKQRNARPLSEAARED